LPALVVLTKPFFVFVLLSPFTLSHVDSLHPLSSFHIHTPVLEKTDANKKWVDASIHSDTACLTFTAPARGKFGDWENVQDNGILEFATLDEPDEPDELRDFRAELRQRRWIKSEIIDPLPSPLHDTVRFSFINAFLATTIV
jgi:hypothetical protein